MAGYIGTTPVPQATQHRESFTATGGQTSFATVGYTPQFIDVYLNGVKLAPADFTATNGSDVVLASGATASDILEIVAYTPFEVANQTFTGDTSVTNLAVTGTFTSRGIDDNADAVAITIDSSENVGIGTSSPSAPLQVKANGTAIALQPTSDTDNSIILFRNAADTANAGAMYYDHTNDAMVFWTNGSTERMRIDSSGNLLVGKTSATASDVGVQVQPIGRVYATRDGDVPLILRRNSSDGNILQFLKDGSTVGSIASRAGVVSTIILDPRSGQGAGITGAGAGGDTTRFMTPTDENGSEINGKVSLGNTANAFRDLYLSGGVYLGGTGSANKLDDYEEGTWTPVVADASSGGNTASGDFVGRYTLIGNQCTVWCRLVNINTSGMTGSNNIYIRGVPFSSSSATTQAHGAVMCDRIIFDKYVVAQLPASSGVIELRTIESNAQDQAVVISDVASSGGSDILFTLTYRIP